MRNFPPPCMGYNERLLYKAEDFKPEKFLHKYQTFENQQHKDVIPPSSRPSRVTFSSGVTKNDDFSVRPLRNRFESQHMTMLPPPIRPFSFMFSATAANNDEFKNIRPPCKRRSKPTKSQVPLPMTKPVLLPKREDLEFIEKISALQLDQWSLNQFNNPTLNDARVLPPIPSQSPPKDAEDMDRGSEGMFRCGGMITSSPNDEPKGDAQLQNSRPPKPRPVPLRLQDSFCTMIAPDAPSPPGHSKVAFTVANSHDDKQPRACRPRPTKSQVPSPMTKPVLLPSREESLFVQKRISSPEVDRRSLYQQNRFVNLNFKRVKQLPPLTMPSQDLNLVGDYMNKSSEGMFRSGDMATSTPKHLPKNGVKFRFSRVNKDSSFPMLDSFSSLNESSRGNFQSSFLRSDQELELCNRDENKIQAEGAAYTTMGQDGSCETVENESLVEEKQNNDLQNIFVSVLE